MFKSLAQIKESFIQGGGRIHRNAVMAITGNFLISALICWPIWQHGHFDNIDRVNLVLDTLNILLMLGVYCFIALIPLKKQIKSWLLAGLLINQISLMLNLLSLYVAYPQLKLGWIGDGAYFVGSVLVAFGATRWVTYTYRVSTLDKLTRLHNRRFFESMVVQHLHRIKRSCDPSCMLSLDMDDFKEINDRYGHATGDEALKSIGIVLTECARKSDIICRSGGEEFEILLVDATLEQAKDIAQRIQTRLAQSTPAKLPTLTASIGLTQIHTEDSIDSLRARADKGMYQAKHSGKARVIVCDVESSDLT